MSAYGPHHAAVADAIRQIDGLSDEQRASMAEAIWSAPDQMQWHYAMSAAGWRAIDATNKAGLSQARTEAETAIKTAAGDDRAVLIVGTCLVTALVARDLLNTADFDVLTKQALAAGIDLG